jgi:hypothetical protein
MIFQETIKWVEKELEYGRDDTVHDFLAYLAGQMIGLNKTKNEEIKGFLQWLEREIGVEIESLANKTSIKEYHENGFDHFLTVLKKNRRRLSIDPSDREKQELLERHYTKSMSILAPLKERIKETDDLIDEIVFRLYDLSDEEIDIMKSDAKNRQTSKDAVT